MKIIHLVLGKANPKRMNGVNKVVHQLANAQAALGQNVQVWGIANNLIPTYPKRNFETCLFQQYKNKTLCSQLKAAIKTLSNTHIVHIHGAFILEFYQVARLLVQQGVAYVFTPHGSYSEAAMEKNKWVKKIYFQLLEKQLIKKAKIVQLLGTNEWIHLQKMMVVKQAQLIPNGMDFQQIPTNLSPQKSEKLTFGFCGRLAIYHKGLDLMLQGFQQFIQEGGQATLALIGDGKDRPILEKMTTDWGIDDQVVFHGSLFGAKKFHTLHTFDVFLHTSRMEGFPMAVLEAAALSKPCLTSEATNINRYIEQYQAGVALTQNTPRGIAKAMHRFAADYAQNRLKKQGQNAHRMVTTAFNWTTIAQQLQIAYTTQ